MNINIEDNEMLHTVIGGLTTDYLDFFCKECGGHIDRTDFYGLDSVGVRLMTVCGACGTASIFKIKCSIPLGPIQFTFERGRHGFKSYHQGKLKTYQKEVREKLKK